MESQQIQIDVRMDFFNRRISLGSGLELVSRVCRDDFINSTAQIDKDQVITYLTTSKNYYVKNEAEFLNRFLLNYGMRCYCEVEKSAVSKAIKEMASDLPVPYEIFAYLNTQFWETLVSVYVDCIFRKSKDTIKMKISSKTYLKLKKDETLDIEDTVECFIGILSAWFAYEQISGVKLCIQDEEKQDPFILIEIKP